ncbi:hypothetical protein M565_ctg2P17 [Vibrio cyclitrophicus FF75]|nr:hypothetical protein M565_ctg2P17 [Vibrio cyclitrophicus FF75]
MGHHHPSKSLYAASNQMMIKDVPRLVATLSVLQLDYEATQQTGADNTSPTCGKENLAP